MGGNDAIIFQSKYICIFKKKLSIKCKHFWISPITFNRVHPQISPPSQITCCYTKGSLFMVYKTLSSHFNLPQTIPMFPRVFTEE